jgi:hypothetical protein
MGSVLTIDNQISHYSLLSKDSLSTMILNLEDKIILLKSKLSNNSLDNESILAICEEIYQCKNTINFLKSVLKDE